MKLPIPISYQAKIRSQLANLKIALKKRNKLKIELDPMSMKRTIAFVRAMTWRRKDIEERKSLCTANLTLYHERAEAKRT